MKLFSMTIRRSFYLLLFVAGLACPGKGWAFYYETAGQYTDAEWPWYNTSEISYRTVNYTGSITSDLRSGLSYSATGETAWIAERQSDGLTFDVSALYYPAVGGDWATFTGTITLVYRFDVAPGFAVLIEAYTVSYSNGLSQSAGPNGGGYLFNTGTGAYENLTGTDVNRLQAIGGPVQLATGAESASRPLFAFGGSRSWGFTLSYNSILARRQGDSPPLGFGWTHNFATRLASSTGKVVVHWSEVSSNTFLPTLADPNVYTSTEDASRYDRVVKQVDGTWILTRRDQSSLLFTSGGQLSEDLDPAGRKLLLTYTSSRLTLVRNPVSGEQLTLAYDGDGRLTTLTDGTGAFVTLNYYGTSSTNRLLSQITNQNQKQATFAYDDKRQLLTVVDHNTATLTANTYDDFGRVTSQDDGVAGNGQMTLAYVEQGMPGSTIYAASDTQKSVPIFLPKPQLFRANSLSNSAGQTVTYGFDANGRLISATLNGQVTTVAYDAEGNAVSVTDPNGQTSPVLVRVVTTVVDRNGKESIHTFDPNYNLLSVRNPLNQTTSYTYDSANRVTSVTDPLNRVSSYTYDAQGNVLTTTDPAGKVTTYTYDAQNNLLTTTEPGGGVTTRTYDPQNNLLTLTDALGRTTTWTYDANSLPLTMTLPGGGVYTYAYTAGRLTQITDPNSVITKFDYDAIGRLLYREDALGKRVTFTYDALGNVLTASNALNETTTYTYDHRNRVATVTDPAGAVTTNTYDHNHNLLTATVTATGLPTLVTTYTYDGEDRLKTVTSSDPDPTATGPGKDPLVTTYHYDDAGRLTSVVAPGGTTTYTYDAAGQLISVTDPAGKVTSSEYDPRGLMTRVTDPLSRSTDFTYDDLGRRITTQDLLSRITQFEYDALHRLTKVTDPGSLVAEQGFDLNGNRNSLKNPAAAITAFAYDAGGRLTSATTPMGHATGYTYDSRGLPASVVEPSAQTTTLTYDDAQRLTSAIDPVGTIIYGRDSAGRVTTLTEGAKVLTRAYDAYGRLTSYTDGDGNVIGYAYDNLGRLTTLTYPGTPLKEVAYTYDAAGRLHTVTDWASRVTTYSYDAVGRLSELLRPNGTKQTRTYDDAGQLTQLTELAPDGTTVIYSGSHAYDLAGQLTSETLNPGVNPQAVAVTQAFDADNRLLTHNGAATTFDADGNLLSIASGVAPASYTYDARNRLTAAGGLAYSYNAENRRVSITSTEGTTTLVVNPLASPDQVLIRTTPDGTRTFYVYGHGLLHEETDSTVRYYHHDRRGDTIALTDVTGAVTDRVSYGVYGELLSRTGTTDTPFLFNGKWGVQTDSNGVYHHRARYYHPQLRRFLNQDTVLGSIGDGASMNRFAYANGNPISLIDPFGLAAQDVAPNSGFWQGLLNMLSFLGEAEIRKAEAYQQMDQAAFELGKAAVAPGVGHWEAANDAYIQGDYAMMWLHTNASFGHFAGLGLFVAGPISGMRVAAERTAGHHTIPRAIQKELPAPVRNHPDVRGRAGNPNIKDIPESTHKQIHSSPPGDYYPGGNYNRRFDELIREQGGYRNMTPAQINQIRDQVMREQVGP